MTEAIIDFLKEKLKRMGRSGEANFIVCHECMGSDWLVVCLSDGESPFIAHLVCKECEENCVLDVTNGIIIN